MSKREDIDSARNIVFFGLLILFAVLYASPFLFGWLGHKLGGAWWILFGPLCAITIIADTIFSFGFFQELTKKKNSSNKQPATKA